MGCNHSKHYKKDSNVVLAYQWDERECGRGSNEFKQVLDGGDDKGLIDIAEMIDPKINELVDIIMMHAVRKWFCSALDFEPAVKVVNEEWAPKIEESIKKKYGDEETRFTVDAFTWFEWHYNGQTAYKKTFFVIRVKNMNEEVVKEE